MSLVRIGKIFTEKSRNKKSESLKKYYQLLKAAGGTHKKNYLKASERIN